MKSRLFVLFLFLAGPLCVFSQIASPTLNPSNPIINPSSAAFRKESGISLSQRILVDNKYKDLKKTKTLNEDKSETSDASQTKLLANYAKNGLGAELYYNTEKVNRKYVFLSGEAKIDQEQKELEGNLSYLVYEILSLGFKVGQNSITINNDDVDIDIIGLGASFQVYNFFFGYSLDKVTQKPEQGDDTKYDETALGVAFSYGSPRDYEFRVEYGLRNRPENKSDSLQKREDKISSIEFTYNTFFLGLYHNETTLKTLQPSDTDTIDTDSKLSIGIKPHTGFYALFEVSRTGQEFKNDQKSEETFGGLAIGYLF